MDREVAHLYLGKMAKIKLCEISINMRSTGYQ